MNIFILYFMERCYFDLKNKYSSTEVLKFVKFSPPKKSNFRIYSVLYELLEIPSINYKVCSYYKKYQFVHKKYKVKYPWIRTHAYRVKKSNNKTIVILHIINKK